MIEEEPIYYSSQCSLQIFGPDSFKFNVLVYPGMTDGQSYGVLVEAILIGPPNPMIKNPDKEDESKDNYKTVSTVINVVSAVIVIILFVVILIIIRAKGLPAKCSQKKRTDETGPVTLSTMPNTNQQTDSSRVNATSGVSEGFRNLSIANSSNGEYDAYVYPYEIISSVSQNSSGGYTRPSGIDQSANSNGGYEVPVSSAIDESAGSSGGYTRPSGIDQSANSNGGYEVPVSSEIDQSAGSSGGYTRPSGIGQSANSNEGYEVPVLLIDQSAGSATGYVRPSEKGQSVLSSEGYDIASETDQLARSSGGYAKMTFKTDKYDVLQLGQTEVPNFYQMIEVIGSEKQL
ncbi:hypothetical protein PoB_007379100 [Plakobranchus ocellatus]|uniref:Cadherin domain-containing protein n=1 Tax=Plakobranchus ocellatus TaxID=259542 RepID=A0AAV4DT87_9GAST|nr:hypothetical protein PoB_007379100 [Plakobranchus ocellatus]